MHLEHLCDMELTYRDLPGFGANVVLVQPYHSGEGTGYGEGEGTISGPRLNGTVRWVNHPHRRSDETFMPDVHGIILTDEGATLLFSLQGRTTFVGEQGRQLLYMLFETEFEPHIWLNTALCVVEGTISEGRMRGCVHVCIHELE
jgi:hypothetical protein